MFCKDCGVELAKDSSFCGKCGTVTVSYGSFAQPMIKSRVLYIVLAVFLGQLGLHNFYAGYNVRGIWQLVLTIFLFWTALVPIAVWIWAVIEAVVVKQDADGLMMK